jgi:hypothetical protein
MRYFIVIMVILSFTSCETDQNRKYNEAFEILNLEQSAHFIGKDKEEQYFELVNTLDLSLQMGKDNLGGTREELINSYIHFLQSDLVEPNNKEKRYLTAQMSEAIRLIRISFPHIRLPQIKCIVTEGKYFGPRVYYTRSNAIIIPKIELDSKNKNMVRTLIHEISHIITRFNPSLKGSLYEGIGYHALEKLELSSFLEQRILRNPDGMDINWYIELNHKFYVPIIFSRHSKYMGYPFMTALMFQLFEIQINKKSGKILSADLGKNENELIGYWEKISRNTTYTIHPDEIIADNFVLMVEKKVNKSTWSRLDKNGKLLNAKLELILKKYFST